MRPPGRRRRWKNISPASRCWKARWAVANGPARSAIFSPAKSFAPEADMHHDPKEIHDWLRSLQDAITHEVEQIDGRAQFRRDAWTREAGGGGESRVLQDGAIFERSEEHTSELQSRPHLVCRLL